MEASLEPAQHPDAEPKRDGHVLEPPSDGQQQQQEALELLEEDVDASLAVNFDPDTFADQEGCADDQAEQPAEDSDNNSEHGADGASDDSTPGQEASKRLAEAEQLGEQGPGKRAARPCEVCGEAVAKYCCPGCQCRTCSLACSKQHKVDRSCDGKRDRLGFVPLDQFTDRHLLSDYKLLEEVARADDIAKRVRPPAPKAQLPHHLATLVYQAEKRRIKLLIMPPGMHRRRTNTTRYDGRLRKLSWRVEWVFAAAAHKVVDEMLAEDTTISEALTRHLTWVPGAAARQAPLAAFTEAGVDKLKVFMRKERTPANAPAFYAVDMTRPLGSQLAGKVVVEFPVLVVALPGEEHKYPAAAAQPANHGPGPWGQQSYEHAHRGRGYGGGRGFRAGGTAAGGQGRGGRGGAGGRRGSGRHTWQAPHEHGQHQGGGGGGPSNEAPRASQAAAAPADPGKE